MGKLRVEGHAKKEFACDRIDLTITFCNRNTTSDIALKASLKQTEDFLAEIKKIGLEPSDVKIDNDSVEQHYDEKKGPYAEAERRLEISLPFDMAVVNSVLHIVRQNKYNVDVDTRYQLTRQNEIQKELIREAIEDSRKQADMLAEMLGQKITGVHSAQIPTYEHFVSYERERSLACLKASLSDELAAPTREVSADVTIVWLVE